MSNGKKRILFVDDQPNVIEGLRRMLHKQRQEWDMVFVTNAREALAKMDEAPFDVILTDLVMPDMGGAELLERVRERRPDTARIVLSGYADEKATVRAAGVAHRFLSKPADVQDIKMAITHACSMPQAIENKRVRAAVASCSTLPSLPTLYIEVARAAESETTDMKRIARLISRDMAMSAKILQLVNSSFFGIGRRISSIEQTVALLGLVRVKALILTQHLFRELEPSVSLAEFSIPKLWEHSAQVAEVARRISEVEGQRGDRPDQAFTAGLLHDVGKLLLVAQFADGYREVLRQAREQPRPVYQIEADGLQVTHAEIGGCLLGLWGLPPRLVEAVTLHHTPGESPYNGLCALTAVHAADALVHQVLEPDPALGAPACQPEPDLAYLQRTGLASRLECWRELAVKTIASHAAGAV